MRLKTYADPMARQGGRDEPPPLFAPAEPPMGSTRDLFQPRDIEIPTKRGTTPIAAESKAAYAVRSQSDAGIVLALIVAEPRTLDEVAVLMKKQCHMVAGRLHELAKAGLIARTGLRRMTRSNRPAAVWEATGKGKITIKGSE